MKTMNGRRCRGDTFLNMPMILSRVAKWEKQDRLMHEQSEIVESQLKHNF